MIPHLVELQNSNDDEYDSVKLVYSFRLCMVEVHVCVMGSCI